MARAWLNVLDWHPVAPECLAPDERRRWHFTGVPGRSFCIDADDNSHAELETIARARERTT